MIDLNELERLANEATPGPWITNVFGTQVLTGDEWGVVCIMRDYAGSFVKWEDGKTSKALDSNGKFIAAFNPFAAQELIRRLREAEHGR